MWLNNRCTCRTHLYLPVIWLCGYTSWCQTCPVVSSFFYLLYCSRLSAIFLICFFFHNSWNWTTDDREAFQRNALYKKLSKKLLLNILSENLNRLTHHLSKSQDCFILDTPDGPSISMSQQLRTTFSTYCSGLLPNTIVLKTYIIFCKLSP